MSSRRKLSMSIAFVLLLVGLPHALAAAEPQLQPQPLFAARVDAGGVEVTFAVGMSSVSTYPVTIMAIGGAVEELLYQGVLSEGIYTFKAPLKQVPPGPVKVLVKFNLVNRSVKGTETFTIYKTWEGSFSR